MSVAVCGSIFLQCRADCCPVGAHDIRRNVPLWIERYIIPILAAVVVGLVILNPRSEFRCSLLFLLLHTSSPTRFTSQKPRLRQPLPHLILESEALNKKLVAFERSSRNSWISSRQRRRKEAKEKDQGKTWGVFGTRTAIDGSMR